VPPEDSTPEQKKRIRSGSKREKKLAPTPSQQPRKNTGSIVGSPFGSWRKGKGDSNASKEKEKEKPKEKSKEKPKTKSTPQPIKADKGFKKDIAKSLKTPPPAPGMLKPGGSKRGKSPSKQKSSKNMKNMSKPDTKSLAGMASPDFSAQLAAKLASRPQS